MGKAAVAFHQLSAHGRPSCFEFFQIGAEHSAQ
jgi:hypothetical protein